MAAWLLGVAFWLPFAYTTYAALAPSPLDTPFRLSDMVLHVAAFTYLSAALVHAHLPRRMLLVAALMLGYGAAIEIAQSFLAERTAEWKDLWMDMIGIALGLAAARVTAAPVARFRRLAG